MSTATAEQTEYGVMDSMQHLWFLIICQNRVGDVIGLHVFCDVFCVVSFSHVVVDTFYNNKLN